MRFLIVGAGAPRRLISVAGCSRPGRDVTFLLRARARGARSHAHRPGSAGPAGDLHIGAAPHRLSSRPTKPLRRGPGRLQGLTTSRRTTMASFAAAVGPNTAILPLLNGMGHIDRRLVETLRQRQGPRRPLHDLDAASMEKARCSDQNDLHGLTFDERGEHDVAPRVEADRVLSLEGANFNAVAAATSCSEMWEKWAIIATTAGLTSLMRATVGDIVTRRRPGHRASHRGRLRRHRGAITAYPLRKCRTTAHAGCADCGRLTDNRFEVPGPATGRQGGGGPHHRRPVGPRADALRRPCRPCCAQPMFTSNTYEARAGRRERRGAARAHRRCAKEQGAKQQSCAAHKEACGAECRRGS